MGLSLRLIIIKGKIENPYEQFIEDLGFNEPKKIGDKDLLSCRVLPNNQIAIGECNGFVFICHHEIPMYLIANQMSRNNYGRVKLKLDKITNESRYIAAIFQSSINGFGYGIYDGGQQVRQLLGDYEGIMETWGEVQDEEKMIQIVPETGIKKAIYQGKEHELHEVGTELTHEILDNYCGQHFLMEGLVLTLFEIN